MKTFLGVDVGGSKTHALVADESGRCLGFGRAGGGNHQNVGYDGLAAVVEAAVAMALGQAGLSPSQLAGAGFGIAGYDWPSERTAHLESLTCLGLTCPVEIANDAVNGLLAGTSYGWGINVAAGSSINCRGRDRSGREGRIVGNGTLFGENGGAMEIVFKALQAVNHAWIRRAPPTRLTGLFLQSTGADDELDLMEGLSNEDYHLPPRLAIEITQAARDGDPVAAEVVRWTGEELGWLAVAVARQLGLEDEEVEVVLSGGVFEAGLLIVKPMEDVVRRHLSQAKLIRLGAPPVVGAVLLGMQAAGLDGFGIREELIRTIGEVVLC